MRAWILAFIFISGCSTFKTSEVRPRTCGSTPLRLKDMESFGFTPPKNKIVIMRIFATWCPYCKDDLAEIGKRFKAGSYKPENVHVLLLSYRNRREDKGTYDQFVKETFPSFGIPNSAAQIVWVDKDYKELVAYQASDKKSYFPDWKGVPYALLFGKDGRLAYRGHFSSSPAVQEAHYQLIQELQTESCQTLP